MTVAILHYHLRRGGVTRVIEGQSLGLAAEGIKHIVLSGTDYHGDLDLPVVVVPDLDYRDHDSEPLATADLLASLEQVAADALGAPPDLWHIHNHALGKNAVVSDLIAHLASKESSILLQLHDFAEDGRPSNFLALHAIEEIYPLAPHVHYAFINSRDQGLLEAAGIPLDRCHPLPNAVTLPAIAESVTSSPTPIVLYPVRGIRRKNLGELCLIAALAPAGSRFAVSLSPENPAWRRVHDRWQEFATEHALPVEFGVVGRTPPVAGVEPSFENWLAHSTHFITTSIAEGFGLAFFEPLALGKPLLGRDLPEITADFKQSGLHLGNLYQSIPIPLEMLNLEKLRGKMVEDLEDSYRKYQRELPPEIIERTWESLTSAGSIDFGNLPENFQEEVIRLILAAPEEFPFTTWVRAALATPAPDSAPADLRSYGLTAYRAQLVSLYEKVRADAASPPEFLPKEDVLAQFLKPERFHFLRT